MRGCKILCALRSALPLSIDKRLPFLLFLFAVSACSSTRYMGISLQPGAADSTLQHLAARAQAGDKQAQLDLGIRFEEGSGVVQSREHAMHLYRQAASDSGGTMWIYSPPVGDGLPGRVIPIDRRVSQRGLSEARCRLAARRDCGRGAE